jgi:hypothetical protein
MAIASISPGSELLSPLSLTYSSPAKPKIYHSSHLLNGTWKFNCEPRMSYIQAIQRSAPDNVGWPPYPSELKAEPLDNTWQHPKRNLTG